MNERETIDRGWYYVIEPEGGRYAPESDRIVADDGRVLTRALHGHPGRTEVVDRSGAGLPAATLLRAAAAVGAALEARGEADAEVFVELAPAGTVPVVDRAPDGRARLVLDGPAVASSPSHHPVRALVAGMLPEALPPRAPVTGALPPAPAPRALFFESLMNTDMPHNDREISQGVLHMISTLRGTGTEVVLVNAKMPIVGDDRPVLGLERLVEALRQGPVHFVGITLLEGYWEGVRRLIRTIREVGCRAHIAVGGVMPSLAPEHVAAHLEDVSFVCRGAGEHFVPRLTRILGTTTVDEPFTEAQRAALLDVHGMIVVERAGPGLRLLSCRSDRTARVEDLDRVPLDLSHVQARHIEGGIELSTSRGCIHKCSFCSILGRESYQARSAGSIFDLLRAYEARFRELHGDAVPPNAYRVHISDDDFACDRARARAFFERLLDTPFRLSSVQVAVGDLCRRQGGRLLAEPDHELLDAMKPACFADHGRPIPKQDFYEDHKSRNWSSFLQIGVETYDDREIARLGKGYRRVHVRAVVAELARRGLHMDGYFILSNADTTAEDLVSVFTEVARLKLRFPEHFHLRFPVVPHLVSYFTAASHRRHVRKGRAHVMKLRGFASVPSHPEYDYPFVDHDVPEDDWVERTVQTGFVTDQGVYTGNLAVLSAMWRPWLAALPADHPDRLRIGRLIRVLDDRPRRLVFDMLRHAWLGDDPEWPGAVLDRERALETAERVLGPHEDWLPLLRHVLREGDERRLVLVTSGTPDPVVDGALDLLAASDRPRRALHLVQAHGEVEVERLLAIADRARARMPEVRLILDGDGWTWTPEAAAALAARDVEVQFVRRLPDVADVDVSTLRSAGVAVRVVLQVPPAAVDALPAAFRACAAGGVPEVALEPLPEPWEEADAERLGRALFALAPHLHGSTTLLDVVGHRERSGHFAEVLVDRDGAIGRSDGVVPGAGLQPAWRLARLEDLTNVDRHALEIADGRVLSGVTRLEVLRKRRAPADQVIARFARWVRGRGDEVRPEV